MPTTDLSIAAVGKHLIWLDLHRHDGANVADERPQESWHGRVANLSDG
jgi:hypothetical protein